MATKKLDTQRSIAPEHEYFIPKLPPLPTPFPGRFQCSVLDEYIMAFDRQLIFILTEGEKHIK